VALGDVKRAEVSYQTILVGTDGSPRAAVAVREALDLAKLSGAALHVINAVHPAAGVGFADSRSAQFQVNEMREQADLVKTLVLDEGRRRGVEIEFHAVAADDPADALVELAGKLDADLVVVGNRGMSGVKRFVLGSVPNKVSHHCPCSVLIVNTDAD
jgi:nucleotide-binding universal stress UspA family protein